MIGFLIGKVAQKKQNQILLSTVSGVGYEVHVSAPFFLEIAQGSEQKLYTYLKVSENAMELFGFKTFEDKRFFELLLTVNGIGPKSAINILGLGSLGQIQGAIARSDVPYLTQVSGIGRKTAERLCVELKNKINKETEGNLLGQVDGSLGEVIEALVGMGYSRDEAREVIKNLDPSENVTLLLKKALKQMR